MMSEKVFLLITAVFVAISAIGPTFFGLNFVIAFICCLIPLACLPIMLADKKSK